MKERMPKLENWELELHSRLSPFSNLIFAGLVKNAGKTTALNAVNALFLDKCLGLTSFGYDGEAQDAIYHHLKPSIPVFPGQLVLTSERFLPDTLQGYDLLESWGKHPQFGSWLLLKITAPCDFRMAGPSTLSELMEGISRLRHYGATRIHVDGALNRLSHISLNTLGNQKDIGIILSTGAAVGNTLNEVVERTRHILELFQLPVFSPFDNFPLGIPTHDIPTNHNAYFHHGSWFNLPSFLWNQDTSSLIPPQSDIIYLKGALTDYIYLALRGAGRLPREFVVKTPAHILLSPNVWNGIKSRGIRVKLLEHPNLLFLTLNPWHPLTPISTKQIAEALLPYTHIPLVDIQKQHRWMP